MKSLEEIQKMNTGIKDDLGNMIESLSKQGPCCDESDAKGACCEEEEPENMQTGFIEVECGCCEDDQGQLDKIIAIVRGMRDKITESMTPEEKAVYDHLSRGSSINAINRHEDTSRIVVKEPTIKAQPILMSEEMEAAGKWIDIASEKYRAYHFFLMPGRPVKVIIDEPEWLLISENGHRIVKKNGKCVYVPMEWMAMSFEVHEDEPKWVR